jgi:hypothetical protein
LKVERITFEREEETMLISFCSAQLSVKRGLCYANLFTSEKDLRLNVFPAERQGYAFCAAQDHDLRHQQRDKGIIDGGKLQRAPHGMAADSLDDDYFSDDGFDTLPPSTLLQLEQGAFEATQQQQKQVVNPYQNQQRSSKAQLKPQTNLQQRAESTIHGGAAIQQPAVINLASSDYGDLDVGELDAGVLDNGEDPSPFEETKRMLVMGFKDNES